MSDPSYFDTVLHSLTGSVWSFGIALTFLVYYASIRLHGAIGAPVFLHPLLFAIAAIALLLQVSGVPYERYFQSAEPLHLLLGPVVVLLAVPLWRQKETIKRMGIKPIPVLFIGAVTGIATSAGVAVMLGAPAELAATLAPKSVTTPVAINLSEGLGGVPAITAVVVILTGLTGACLGWPILQRCGIYDPCAKGFAIGVAPHVIGTARVLQIDQRAGAFSGLGMILNALMTTGLIALLRLAIG